MFMKLHFGNRHELWPTLQKRGQKRPLQPHRGHLRDAGTPLFVHLLSIFQFKPYIVVSRRIFDKFLIPWTLLMLRCRIVQSHSQISAPRGMQLDQVFALFLRRYDFLVLCVETLVGSSLRFDEAVGGGGGFGGLARGED